MVTNKVGAIKSNIYADSIQKIQTTISIFERYVSFDPLVEKLTNYKPQGRTPRMFQYDLVKRARQSKNILYCRKELMNASFQQQNVLSIWIWWN